MDSNTREHLFTALDKYQATMVEQNQTTLKEQENTA